MKADTERKLKVQIKNLKISEEYSKERIEAMSQTMQDIAAFKYGLEKEYDYWEKIPLYHVDVTTWKSGSGHRVFQGFFTDLQSAKIVELALKNVFKGEVSTTVIKDAEDKECNTWVSA